MDLKPPKHFYSLDALRGLAALSVVFTHWDILMSLGNQPKPDPATLPLSLVFRPFYEQGWRAVDLFFCLSGFIFYWLYARAIVERRVAPYKFAVLRFSRLYPLHFVTLVYVALGQYLVHQRTGSFLKYHNNTPAEFVKQVFFVHDWNFTGSDGFNGPTWSISIEMGLYLVFFCLCFARLTRWWVFVGLIAAMWALRVGELLPNEAFRGLTNFFVGCLTYIVYARLATRGISRRMVVAGLGVSAVLWILAALPMTPDHPVVRLVHRFGGRLVRARLDADPQFPFRVAANLGFNYAVFPLTILALALAETRRGTLGKRVAFLGDLSYSSYLLHFPLMLTVVLVFLYAGWSQDAFYSPLMLAGFFVVLVVLSTLCYRRFERPAQDVLRTALLGRRPTARQAPPPALLEPTPAVVHVLVQDPALVVPRVVEDAAPSA